ncbi:MAG: hypothetical protein HY978_04865 [Candidatus Liptonbacteria bacterium]|nr:hypothetical protein [Candidatus Liptonbacteria bacterium]
MSLGFRITALGRKLLAVLEQQPHRPSLPPPHYDPTGPDKFVVVAFDVPEKERWKRRWLRSVLTNLNLHLVQRSVWVGKAAIPKQFVQDLAALNLLEAVEIFEVTKTGTLRHLI